MYDEIDLELARQRREELLREAHERRIARASGWTPSRDLRTPVRRLVRYLQPERSVGLATTEKPGVPIHGCSVD